MVRQAKKEERKMRKKKKKAKKEENRNREEAMKERKRVMKEGWDEDSGIVPSSASENWRQKVWRKAMQWLRVGVLLLVSSDCRILAALYGCS